MAASMWADGGKASVGGWIMTAKVLLKAFSPLWVSVFIGCLPLSWQPWLQQWEDDQQVAIGVGEDLLQLGLHCPVRVDPCGSAGPGQQRFWLKHRLFGALLRLFQQCCPFSLPAGGSLTGRSILDDGSPAATPGLMWWSVLVWHVKRSPTLDVLVVSTLYFFRLLQCCHLIAAFLVVLAVVLLLHQLVYHH